MAKSNWVTQKVLSIEWGVTPQCISNWIKRKQIKSKLNTEFNVTVVDKNSITIKNEKYK